MVVIAVAYTHVVICLDNAERKWDCPQECRLKPGPQMVSLCSPPRTELYGASAQRSIASLVGYCIENSIVDVPAVVCANQTFNCSFMFALHLDDYCRQRGIEVTNLQSCRIWPS